MGGVLVAVAPGQLLRGDMQVRNAKRSLASSLLGLRKELQCIKSFGTDGEKALVDAFVHEFRFATHLYCTIHARKNV